MITQFSLLVPFAFAGLLMACGDDDHENHGAEPNGDEAATASGLYETDEGFVLDLAFDPDPPRTGEVDLHIELSLDEQPVEEAHIEIEPWMPSHGHGANTVPQVHEMGDGQYHVDELTFSMPGHWELAIDIEAREIKSSLLIDLDVEG